MAFIIVSNPLSLIGIPSLKKAASLLNLVLSIIALNLRSGFIKNYIILSSCHLITAFVV